MKNSFYKICFVLTIFLSACTDLNIPPLNVVTDDDIFTSDLGINSYMARLYSRLPIEDFRYSPTRSFNNFYVLNHQSNTTGEALSRDQTSSHAGDEYWSTAYSLLRELNLFLETLPKYASRYTKAQLDLWNGEVYFIRAVNYLALVKRYGGVPIVNKVLNYPEQPIEELHVARSSEEATWDQVGADLDLAYSLLPETNQVGNQLCQRINVYQIP